MSLAYKSLSKNPVGITLIFWASGKKARSPNVQIAKCPDRRPEVQMVKSLNVQKSGWPEVTTHMYKKCCCQCCTGSPLTSSLHSHLTPTSSPFSKFPSFCPLETSSCFAENVLLLVSEHDKQLLLE